MRTARAAWWSAVAVAAALWASSARGQVASAEPAAPAGADLPDGAAPDAGAPPPDAEAAGPDASVPADAEATPPGPPAPATLHPSGAATTGEEDEDYTVVQVRGQGWASPRGIDDVRIKRELLEASPRMQTSEMLSAAPGFFVDHEDGEGLGNDVYLRGFDLEHGSGIEMRVDNVPINSPVHVQGQGYADVNFIIPEVVRSIRVLEGPFDPRQGDAAIVGSAYFDLGVPDRGYQAKATYGSFDQVRVVGVAAPKEADDETFAAFAVRKSDGFGENRATESATVNAQYSFDVTPRDHLRLLATAYGAREALPGVLREPDVHSGAIGYYDSYPEYANGQGVQASRVILAADFDHVAPGGDRFEIAPWVMWTDLRTRENFTGNLNLSQIDPNLAAGEGDLWETTNRETAVGASARFHTAPLRAGGWFEASPEAGVSVRAGHTNQTKSLLDSATLAVWDRRLDAGLDTLDAAAYVNLDMRFWRRFRVSGGLRADLLQVSVDDRLAYDVPANVAPPDVIPGSNRATQGVPLGPRVTAEVDVLPELTTAFSYGTGFRSLDATANVATQAGTNGAGPSIQESAKPFSNVDSAELGFRAHTRDDRYTATAAGFETWVQNELVFEATSGGFTTEGASTRRGIVASAIARPFDWLLASVAASFTEGTFHTLVAGVDHYIPQVPPVVLRADVTVRGTLATVRGRPLTGKLGVGYTYLAPRYLSETNATIRGAANDVLNANGSLRYGAVELGLDVYNLLALKYADDGEYFASNWSVTAGAHPFPSYATHLIAAPPLTVLGSIALYF